PGTLARRLRHHPLGSQNPSGPVHGEAIEDWYRCYILMGWYKRKDYGQPEPPESYWYMPSWYRYEPPEPYTPAQNQHLLEDWRPMYWSCDRVRVQADWKDSGNAIRLQLTP